MNQPELDLDGILRDHFERRADGIDAHEDWGDLTGRIRARARRRVQIVSCAAAVAVVAGLGAGFAWGELRSPSGGDAGTVASSDGSGAGPGESPAPAGAPAPSASDDRTSAGVAAGQDRSTPGTPTEPSSNSLMTTSPAPPTSRTTASGVNLTAWPCADGSTTIDAATSDTVGRLGIGPIGAPPSRPALSAVAIVEGAGRPRQLVVVGVWAPGATRLRATFPDGSTDTTAVTGPATALALAGSAQPGSTVRVESLTGTGDNVVAGITLTTTASTDTASAGPGC